MKKNTEFGFSEDATMGANLLARHFQRRDDCIKDTLSYAYALRGRELELLALVVQHRSIRRIAALMDIPAASVVEMRKSIMGRLGTRRVRDLISLLKRTQGEGADQTEAEYQYRYVLPVLEGARIIAPVLKDRDWCGLIVRLEDGSQRIVWLNDSQQGDQAGWVRLEVAGEPDRRALPVPLLREITTKKIEQLMGLLDELDGDPDWEPELLEEDGGAEPAEVPADFGEHHIRQRPKWVRRGRAIAAAAVPLSLPTVHAAMVHIHALMGVTRSLLA